MPLRNSHSQIENQIDSFIQNFKRNSAVFVSQLNLDSYGASLRHTFSAGQISPTTDYGTRSKRSSFVSTYSSSSRRTSTDGTNLSFSEAESYDEEADISESSSGKYILNIIIFFFFGFIHHFYYVAMNSLMSTRILCGVKNQVIYY